MTMVKILISSTVNDYRAAKLGPGVYSGKGGSILIRHDHFVDSCMAVNWQQGVGYGQGTRHCVKPFA